MRHRGVPYRQCAGCRKVLPKRDLLRFLPDAAGGAVFDERQKAGGRGFYLCPDRACFAGAWKNRRMRALVKDEKAGERLFHSVDEILGNAVEGLATGPGAAGGDSLPSLDAGDVLLVRADMDAQRREELVDAARERGVLVFVVPRTVLRGAEAAAITKNSPKRAPLLRNLRFYERLSSKGRAL